jgi:hypothetical protein
MTQGNAREFLLYPNLDIQQLKNVSVRIVP